MDKLHKKYAFITYMDDNENKIIGSIILAESLRKVGSIVESVILITQKVKQENIELIKKFYDRIITVDDIKISVLKLVEYEKILFVNPDTLILKNIDDLYNLNTPAGIYLPNTDYYMDKSGINEWYKKYSDCCSHGKKIPKYMIDRNINSINNNILLLKPDNNLYNTLINSKKNIINAYNAWYSIDPKYLGLEGYPHIDDLYMIHYMKEKPYILESTIPLEERIKYEHFKIWHYYYRDVINKYPELLENIFLKEVNEIANYFIIPLSRYTSEIVKKMSFSLKNSVNSIFGKVKNHNYYHINISKEYGSDILVYKQEHLDEKDFYNYVVSNDNVCIIMVINPVKEENYTWLDNTTIKNVLQQTEIIIDGYILKNVLFNIEQNYVYKERLDTLNNLYQDVLKYRLTLYIYKTIADSGLISNDNVHVYTDIINKMRVMSILYNNNTLEMFKNKKIMFIDETRLYSKNMLLYQSLKKWLYNLYDADSLENIIIDKFFADNVVIYDTNKYKIIDMKMINDKKLHFMDIKFIHNNDKIIKYINNPEYYFRIEGIKFIKN